MKLTIKWRYPDEKETHEHTFYDINPASVSIQYGALHFNGIEDPHNKSWHFQLNMIVSMEMEEE